MIEAPKEWKVLVKKTIETIDGIDKMTGRKQPLAKSIIEFAQLLIMLAIAGGKEFDGGDGDDKGT